MFVEGCALEASPCSASASDAACGDTARGMDHGLGAVADAGMDGGSGPGADAGLDDGSGPGVDAGLDGALLDELFELYRDCRLCPRSCGKDRIAGRRGVCGADARLRMGRAALHWWEEPPLVGERGSGTVFFSFCPLGCVYCQNVGLAAGEGVELASVASDVEGKGRTPSGIEGCETGHTASDAEGQARLRFAAEVAWLQAIMLRLQDQEGAANVNLVTPTHFLPHVIAALSGVSDLHVPIVYNTSGYESAAQLRRLDGLVDVYLTDLKYVDVDTARRYSHADDYPQHALEALDEMLRQTGPVRLDADGMLQGGTIVRHLVLPNHIDGSLQALETLQPFIGKGAAFSIMNQFTSLLPPEQLRELGLAGGVSAGEYEQVLDHADELGFAEYFWQEGGADSESFIPAFDGTGLAVGDVSEGALRPYAPTERLNASK